MIPFKKFFDYLLVYLLLAYSVVPFFRDRPDSMAIVTFLLIVYYIYSNNKLFPLSKPFLQTLLLLTIMYVGQLFTLELKDIDYRSIIGTYIRFSFPYLVILVINSNFIEKYTRVNYILAILVLILWTIENLFPPFTILIKQISTSLSLDIVSNENILIYNTEAHAKFFGIIRNAGIAYESGAYAITLLIAFSLNYVHRRSLRNRESYMLFIATLTTFSTAAYLSLFIILLGINLIESKHNYLRLIVSTSLFFLLTIYLFNTTPFLRDKIEEQMTLTQESQFATRGRFASAQADLMEWQRNPIFGVGKFEESRFSLFFKTGEQHRVNGLADFLAKFGALFFVGYYFIMYKSMQKYCQNNGVKSKIFVILTFFGLVALTFAQMANQWSVYIFLLYLPLLLKEKSLPNEKNTHNLP